MVFDELAVPGVALSWELGQCETNGSTLDCGLQSLVTAPTTRFSGRHDLDTRRHSRDGLHEEKHACVANVGFKLLFLWARSAFRESPEARARRLLR